MRVVEAALTKSSKDVAEVYAKLLGLALEHSSKAAAHRQGAGPPIVLCHQAGSSPQLLAIPAGGCRLADSWLLGTERLTKVQTDRMTKVQEQAPKVYEIRTTPIQMPTAGVEAYM